mmetsp:Transcript_76346/g.127249  ORF Transcript_76346/g.127249 Transcript_76346/m.127249 type:complete len:112 (-) Transcript_76346:437-772(-)
MLKADSVVNTGSPFGKWLLGHLLLRPPNLLYTTDEGQIVPQQSQRKIPLAVFVSEMYIVQDRHVLRRPMSSLWGSLLAHLQLHPTEGLQPQFACSLHHRQLHLRQQFRTQG